MDSLSALGPALVDLAVKATVLLTVTTVVIGLMRRASAASRHVVWTAALAGVALLPVARVALPSMPLLVLPPSTANATINTGLASFNVPVASPAVSAGAVTEPRQAVRTAAPERNRWTWAGVAVVVWLIGAASLLVRLVAGTVGVSSVARRARPLDDPHLVSRVQHLAGHLHVRRTVTTLVWARDLMPLTWGVLHPTILLPPSAARWSDERLDAVLVHELAHVARLDALSHLVARLSVTLVWFNPLIWFAARQARLERERACDDLVLEHGTRATRYADDLLTLIQLLATPALPSTAAVPMARKSQIEGRLTAILNACVNRRGHSRMSVALAAALIVMTLPVAAARLASPPDAVTRIGSGHARQTAEWKDSDFTNRNLGPQATSQIPQGNVTAERARVLHPAFAARGLAEENTQAERAPVNFSGEWAPSDAEKIQALFEVGRIKYPGSGMTIVQDASTLAITRVFTAFRRDRTVTTVYNLDGSASTNTGLVFDDPQVGSARWDREHLVITATTANGDVQDVLSMRGADLEVVETIHCAIGAWAYTLLFHKRAIGSAAVR